MTRYYWMAETDGGVVIPGFEENTICKSTRAIMGRSIRRLEVWDHFHSRKVKEIVIPLGAEPRIIFRTKMSSTSRGQPTQVFGWRKPDYDHLWEFYRHSPVPKFVGRAHGKVR